MSIYSECADAARKLMGNPPQANGGVFTELEVVQLAQNSKWSTEDWKAAMRHANQVLGQYYRARKLCRFGPVQVPNGEGTVEDYGRIASKIVYAGAEKGPDVWETPNGDFWKLMFEDDEIAKAGRKHSANRSDLVPWAEQNALMPPPKEIPMDVRVETMERTIRELATRVEALEGIEAERKRMYASR